MLWVYSLKWGRGRHALAEENIGELVKKNDEFETCPKPTTKKDVLEKTEELLESAMLFSIRKIAGTVSCKQK